MPRKKNTPLTPRQEDELRRALVEKRAELRARIAEVQAEPGFEPAPDPMDVATEVIAGNEIAALSAHDASILIQIDEALRRMAAGRYGLSEDSGEPIPYARLRSIPWARRTAEEEEDASSAAQSFR